MKRILLSLLLVCLIFSSIQLTAAPTDLMYNDVGVQDELDGYGLLSADPGVLIPSTPYIVLELTAGDISCHGSEWSALLNSIGVSNILYTTSEILADTELIHNAPAIIIDGSLGSSNGIQVSQAVVDLLIRQDIPLILTGQSTWMFHRLSGRSPPSTTALVATTLASTSEFAGAVFLSQPVPLSIGSSLTSETGLVLPIDTTQTEMSRLVNLTGSSSSVTAPLRYDSWPLDIFLFGLEDPTLLSSTGEGLFENTVAYCNAIRETTTTAELSQLQADEGSILGGGFSYTHSPSLVSTYYAVHSAHNVLEGTAWTNWVTANTPLVRAILNNLMFDYGSETGFMTSAAADIVSITSTAQGLWTLTTMGLSGEFPVSEIVEYLSSRQEVEGGFDNYISTTFYVTEALAVSGQLSEISEYDLELWLRSLVIDGSKTSDPDLWGSIGSNPSSINPCTNYAVEYLRSLAFIGKAHPDPAKLTNWILSRTTVGDGSFRNTNILDEEVVTGTASALATMQILGTLSSQNKTNGLLWFTNNQLDSGGFGMKDAANDIGGKARETSRVAFCLDTLGKPSGSIATGISNFIDSVTTVVGFEAMDNIPSLMWTKWLLETSRFAHASPSIDLSLVLDYLNSFDILRVYPYWDNLTTVSAPEYGSNQYRTLSVWTLYFGVATSAALGIEFDPQFIADITLYLSQSQYMTGHFKPTLIMGTAHMQHSVAAVETLYLLDELDTIPYRASLETAILSEYSAGTWDSTGWALEPFAGFQESIDFLSTQAAVRLGILTPTMAAEITTSINSRIQYTDLMALSMDVATLSLLHASAFSSTLDSVDSSSVLSALRSSYFTNGWFNSTMLWQPVFTQSVLKMVSILGLRCQLYDTLGTTLSASTSATAELGSTIDISVSISSPEPTHTLIVDAFGETTLFSNVANSDTLTLPVPSSLSTLSSWDIFVRVQDWGSSRGFDKLTIQVDGTLNGSLILDTPAVKMSEKINGSASWTLTGGGDAGLAHITIRLGDSPTYQQYSYDETSPFQFSIPSTDFDAGIYNLTVTIDVSNCAILILQDQVTIAEPDLTYLTSPIETSGLVGTELSVSWSLYYQVNDSLIANQEVLLQITDEFDTVVHSTMLTSTSSSGLFHWTSTERGDFTYTLTFAGNGTLDGSQSQGTIHVFEATQITWIGTGTRDQHSTITLTIQLTTQALENLNGQSVHVTISSPTLITIIDTILITNSTGHASVTITISENGDYVTQADFSGVGFLLSSSDSDSVISWSSSHLEIDGVVAEETIGGTRTLWAQLKDLISNPISGQFVTLRVVLLPSTTIMEQVLATNSSGHVSMSWSIISAGSFRYEVDYSGTFSRGSDSETFTFDVLIPVTLTVSYNPLPEVGIDGWIQVIATDHLSNPITGLTVTVSVERPGGGIDYTDISTTSGGIVVFTWTPSTRGINDVTVISVRQSWHYAGFTNLGVGVYETPTISINIPSGLIAPTSDSITITLMDSGANPINGATVSTIVSLNGSILYSGNDVTSPAGVITLNLDFGTPGELLVQVQVSTQGWLLETSDGASSPVTSDTTLTVTIPGLPVEQGSVVGVLFTLLDFSDSPLTGASIDISVTWINGTVLGSYSRLTDGSGQCTLAQSFNFVGNFIISGTYTGSGHNSSASDSVPQIVFTTPNVELFHDPSCIVGNPIEFQVALIDSLGDFIIGRTIHLSIEQDGVQVFDTQVPSIDGILTITWYPTQGGLADITILHVGDSLFLTNSTTSTCSVLELVDGELWISPAQVNLFGSTTLTYNLTTAIPLAGVTIHFEVLAMDLVPLWTADVMTNSSGMASVVYVADDAHGVLIVNVGPEVDEFLVGGDVQDQLVVMTGCSVSVSMVPNPPAVDTSNNITFNVIDDLGGLVDGISLTVTVYNPYGQQVKLGLWTNSITVPVHEGVAVVEFTPEMVGLYNVDFTSGGSVSVHGFSDSSIHTIYSGTELSIILSSNDIQVGETLDISTQLLDHDGAPMVGRNVTLFLDGPGASSMGPMELITNATGFVDWSADIAEEGVWTLEASFEGLGVYLPSSSYEVANVKYGTVVQLDLLNPDDVVASMSDALFSILLEDTGGTPLEGFTIHYQAHLESFGLIAEGNLIQSGTDSMILNLTMDRMGSVTFIVSFSGTSHYHASNAAIELLVKGTSTVVSDIPSSIDRSSLDGLQIHVDDEVSLPLVLDELEITLTLQGPSGLVNLTSRLQWNETSVELFITSLPVGQYTLSVIVPSSVERVGCIVDVDFAITSITTIVVEEDGLTGIYSEPQTLVFFLNDSLMESVVGADVWVSIYDSLNREIYGHPLSIRTLLTSSEIGTAVTWIPSLTGEYRVLIDFEGDEFYNQSSIEIVVLVRHPSSLTLDSTLQSEFGEIVPLTVTLTGAIGGLSGETITLRVYTDGMFQMEETLVTGRRGVITHNLAGLLAGTHTVRIIFEGSTSQAPCNEDIVIEVTPVVVIAINNDASLYVGRENTLSVSVSILGTSGNWVGSLNAILLSPTNEELVTRTIEIDPYSVLEMDFLPLVEGTYSLNVTVVGLPVAVEHTYPLAIAVVRESLQIELDAWNTSLLGGFGIVSVIGVIMRKKMKGVVESMAEEWTG
ncbi:MAG: prenyltransferase/squalene oxidase repeat-containing protein [Candidatus Thorarchaeota archaeon]